MRALRSLLLVGALALSAGAAQAAHIGVAIGIGAPVVAAPVVPAPVVYAAPVPGPGYAWVDGYYAGRVWVPGRWVASPGWRAHEWRDAHYDRYHYDRGYHRGWNR